MVWDRILALVGPGLHWDKSKAFYLEAITKAEAAGDFDAADHIRLILDLREKVHWGCEYPEEDPPLGI